MSAKNIVLFWLAALAVVFAATVIYIVQNYHGPTECGVVPTQFNKTILMGFISDTKYPDIWCPLAALNTYGQNALNEYNISLNLTTFSQEVILNHEAPYFIFLIIIVVLMIVLVYRYTKITKSEIRDNRS